MTLKTLIAFLFLSFVSHGAGEINLTQYKGDYCYDGDTCYAELANAPSELKFVRIRIRGIDTPEIKGKCEKERKLAKEAKRFLNKLIMESHLITLRNLNWGKYGGRIIADLYIDNTNYLVYLKGKDFYVPYSGGKKLNIWCK